jgi:serine/threonine protein kinase
MLGSKKIDKYVINLDRQLGKGAFGKVYEGIQDGTNLKVAVKMLDKKSSMNITI